MPTLSIAKGQKAPATTCQFWSDGDTIPFIATATHAVGDVVIRVAANQSIGVVQALAHNEDATATIGDEIQLRVQGAFWAKKGNAALTDGDRVKWDTSNEWFEEHASGPHEVVGGYDAGDSYALVRINVMNEPVQGVASFSPSASPSPSPSSSAS